MHAPSATGAHRLEQLRAQRRKIGIWQGFADASLEQEFAEWMRHEHAQLRFSLLLVPLVALIFAPFYGGLLLDGGHSLAERNVLWLRALELGLGVPLCLAAMWMLKRHKDHPLGAQLFALAGLVLFAVVAAIRWITAQDGGALSAELVMLVPLAYGALGGLSNRTMLPALVLCCLGFLYGEWLLHSGAAFARVVLGVAITGWIASVSAVLMDRLSRRAWLDSSLAALAAMTDGITGLPNRAWFNRDGAHLMRRLHRNPTALAVYLIDLDHFKRLNDSHGHAAGDSALTAVGGLLVAQFGHRPYDLLGRYGGEELVMVLPDVNDQHAKRFAQKLVDEIAGLNIPNSGAITSTLTASIGVWHGTPKPGQRMEDLLALADAALYTAKASGRNQYKFQSI